MQDYTKIISEWESYCRGLAYNMAGVIDIETLAQEARVKVWLLAREYRGEDLARMIRVSVPRHLLNVIRTERAQKRDFRRTYGEGDLLGPSEEDAFEPGEDVGIEDTVVFREGVARLLAMVNEDEKALLDLIVNGSDELREALVTRKKQTLRVRPALFGRALGWPIRRTERAMEGLRRKAPIAFAE